MPANPNGEGVATEKVKKKQIPTRIRNIVNTLGGDREKKELLLYINDLRKKSGD